jgi:UDP-glucose 4-epimerase
MVELQMINPVENVLVTGGAGFVGSHVAWLLCRLGFRVTVVDDLSTGHRAAVPPSASFVLADLRDAGSINRMFAEHRYDTVMHFAAKTLVGESNSRPIGYIQYNVDTLSNVLQAAVEHGVQAFILSSTASIFDSRDGADIDESLAISPGNPYGESKRMCERILFWAERSHGIRTAILRYFNAAGAQLDGDLGEDHRPETHLIPLVLQVALRRRSHIDIFGNDYPTPDGTCVRDYVHVLDLADAHVRSLVALRSSGGLTYNVGSGTGYSVREVIEIAEQVTGRGIATITRPRRAGDPASLVANSGKLQRELGWRPLHSDLRTIIRSAWVWHTRHPDGFDTPGPIPADASRELTGDDQSVQPIRVSAPPRPAAL